MNESEPTENKTTPLTEKTNKIHTYHILSPYWMFHNDFSQARIGVINMNSNTTNNSRDQRPLNDDPSEVSVGHLIVCALSVEVDAMLEALRLQKFKVETANCNGREYYSCSKEISQGKDPLQVIVLCNAYMGQTEIMKTLLHFQKFVNFNNLKSVCMSGICAGLIDKTNLGDVIVADQIFDYMDSAKVKADEGTEYNTAAFRLNDGVAQWVKHQEGKNGWRKYIMLPQVASTRYLTDWVLNKLSDFTDSTSNKTKILNESFDSECIQTGKAKTGDLQTILKPLLAKGFQKALILTEKGREYLSMRRSDAESNALDFPVDDEEPVVRVGTLGTGPSVTENLVELARELKEKAGQRKLIAVEMEAHALFSTFKDQKVRILVAKSVCDHGNEFKDDKIHYYAARTSAAFIVHYLLDYEHKLNG